MIAATIIARKRQSFMGFSPSRSNLYGVYHLPHYLAEKASRPRKPAGRASIHNPLHAITRSYKQHPSTPLSEKELVSLRATLQTSRATPMCRWSLRRDGGAVVIQRVEMW